MKPLKLLLPTVYDPREWGQPYSAASMFLGASTYADRRLREHYDIQLRSFRSSIDPQELAEKLTEGEPDVIGLGIYTWNEPALTQAIPLIKKRLPKVRLLLGGLSVLYADDKYNEAFPEVDLFFRGDAEQVFPEVLRHILDGTYEQVVSGKVELPGVSCHANFKQRVNNRSVVKMSDVVSYYLPDDSGMSFFDRVASEHWDCVWWEMTRGCVYTCAFCGFDAQELGFRHHSVERVLKEFDVFLQKGVRRVFITDAILGGKRANAKEILRGLSLPERKHSMYMYGFIRPEMIDEEFARLLKSAGMSFVNVGLQTVNPQVPKEMRSNQLDEVRRGLPWLSRCGVSYQTDLIAGFPGETFEGFVDSVRFMIEEARPTRFRVYHLSVLPGTRLERIVQANKPGWLTYDKDGLVTSSYSWTQEDLNKMLRFANVSVALYNYLTQRQWLGMEETLRDIQFFRGVFEQAESDPSLAKDLIAWDQKAASLNADEQADARIEYLLERRGLFTAEMQKFNPSLRVTGLDIHQPQLH
jgi:radical SAM superfamily enzyme YgiQ (UPF0313 family)